MPKTITWENENVVAEPKREDILDEIIEVSEPTTIVNQTTIRKLERDLANAQDEVVKWTAETVSRQKLLDDAVAALNIK